MSALSHGDESAAKPPRVPYSLLAYSINAYRIHLSTSMIYLGFERAAERGRHIISFMSLRFQLLILTNTARNQ